MHEDPKGFRWSGVIRSDLKVDIGPAFGKPDELINLSVQSNKTYRNDIDGILYAVYCDNPFDVKVSHKGKLLMILQGEEVLKFWCSTVEEVMASIQLFLGEDDPVFYIYKQADNYYTYYRSEMNLSGEQLIDMIRWQPKGNEVVNEPSTDHHQVQSIRWRGELEPEQPKWSLTQQIILIALFILALAI